MERADFVHLHVHSAYSLLDGACRLEELIASVKAHGQTAVAVTDHGNLYAAVPFYKMAKAAGIRPIIGCEVYVARRTRHDRDHLLDGKSYHLILLCETNEGYQNLMKLVSLANLEGFYHKPRVDWELLQRYHKGLICLSACLAGELPRLLLDGDYAAAKQTALRYRDLFGEGNYFLEIQDHGLPEEKQVLPGLLRIARETGIPLAATNDVHYLRREDAEMHKVLLCIQTGKTISEKTGMGFTTPEYYLRSTEEMAARFGAVPEALTNTRRIADRCRVELTFGERKLPQFRQDGVTDNAAFLRDLCERGLRERYGTSPSQAVRDRLAHELDVIERMGFVDYFLIVWDFIRYARSQDIPVGPGRGSGAGSLCAYCIGITQIDPIRYQLLFERFLNVERGNMPDLDIDFCINGRARVKEYVVRRYGADRVAEIIAFDTLKARAAVKDVGRVLELPYATTDRVSKLIDSNMGLREALDSSKELRELAAADEQIRRLLDLAMKIEGMPRHSSTHAAGVVITPTPVSDYVPLQKSDDTIITQYTMKELDLLGLLKMDFLGLRNLTIIRDAEKAISRHTPGFRVSDVPTDDPAVYALIASGDTSGVFQLESPGMRGFLMRLRPERMEDLIAALALYRPGPMDAIPTYIRNRRDPSQVTYLHPALEDILDVTYGCIVYQEQVMQICRKLAGYSYGQADLVRRVMSKKDPKLMEQERTRFLYGSGQGDGCVGALANGIPEPIAREIFDQMEGFAEYAFNKSHAAAYALVAYHTAYLKRYYFGDYMAALMTSVIHDTGKLLAYIEECRAAGIPIAPPDINKGDWCFTFQDGRMLFGLLAIRGVGKGFIDRLTNERRQKGPFVGFVDFCRRMSTQGLNRRILEPLIGAGALDCLDYGRRDMLQGIDEVLDSLADGHSSPIEGQMSLFGDGASAADGDLTLPRTADFPLLQRLQLEKEATGLYITGHPLDSMRHLQALLHTTPLSAVSSLPERARVTVICTVHGVKKYQTKKGADMAFLELEDASDVVRGTVFPQSYVLCAGKLLPDMPLLIRGSVSLRNDAKELIVETVTAERELPAMLREMRLCIKADSRTEQPLLRAAADVCRRFPGETGVVFYLTDRRGYVTPREPLTVTPDAAFYEALTAAVPADRIGLIPAPGGRRRTGRPGG